MKKTEELSDPKSCLNKAASDEPVFVIRAKDTSAIATILFWINNRIESGKNKVGDEKLKEAYDWCNLAARWREVKGG